MRRSCFRTEQSIVLSTEREFLVHLARRRYQYVYRASSTPPFARTPLTSDVIYILRLGVYTAVIF